MAKGAVHILWWKRLIPIVLIISIGLMFLSPLFGMMCLIGYLIGEPVLSPDLDHQNMTASEYGMMKRFGCLGAIWVGYWQPYGFLFPHRSFWSHFPVVSDLLRMVYLLVIPAVLCLYYYSLPLDEMIGIGIGGMLAGLSLSTTVHYILDQG